MLRRHFSVTLAVFNARIQRTKNRLVAIPADTQRKLSLDRRSDNHILLVSIRPLGAGRWNHHYLKLTFDNEFMIPSDVAHLKQADEVEVKVHRIIEDVPIAPAATGAGSAAGTLLELARRQRPGWRKDGSMNLDAHLSEEFRAKKDPGGHVVPGRPRRSPGRAA